MRSARILLGLVLVCTVGLLGCGVTDDEATSSGSTATTPPSTTTAGSTSSTDEDPTTTTSGGTGSPIGDPELKTLLLTPDELGKGLQDETTADDVPEESFCDGSSFNVRWDAAATISVEDPGEDGLRAAAESVLRFSSGDAPRFMDDFRTVLKACAAKSDGPAFVPEPLPGVGDEAFQSAPTPAAGAVFDIFVVRVGDDVIILIGAHTGKPVVTDAVIAAAVARVEAG